MQDIKRNQSGFTLVEIAIVLVIIGLLLGGVLKGQEMIENARIKSVVNDMSGVTSAFNGYIDRYHTIPGDETLLTTAARGWTCTVGGNANGVLTAPIGLTFTNGAAGEQDSMWQALRAANLVAGNQTDVGVAALPRSGTGGLIGVATGAYGMAGLSVCVSGLSTKQAAGVDTIVDGTLPVTNIGSDVGSARGATAAANPLAPVGLAVATPYNETLLTTWTMCRQM